MTATSRTRIGLIGFGTVARHFAPVIQASSAARIVGALERTDPPPPEVAKAMADAGVSASISRHEGMVGHARSAEMRLEKFC